MNAEELNQLELEADLNIRKIYNEWREAWENQDPAPFVVPNGEQNAATNS